MRASLATPEKAPLARSVAEDANARRAGIAGIGTALPERVVENDEITPRIGVTDDWILKRTGIRSRRYAPADAKLADLAAAAGQAALNDAGLDPGELDLVLVASCSQDSVMPNAAPVVAHALGAERAGAFDIGSACTGFVAALAAARGMLLSGAARSALVIGAEIMSRHVDPNDRNTAALFGDGAGAIVCSLDAPGEIGPVVLGSDGAHAGLIVADRETQLLAMDGHETFKQAVRRLSEATAAAAQSAGTSLAEIDLFIYHQANSRILRSLAERLELAPEKIVDCIGELGNTSAASVPLALAQARANGMLTGGTRMLLAAAGSGFTWGGAVVDWGVR
jgi:3-oxoacyl-[acyl-carrier-protein] synthase-3